MSGVLTGGLPSDVQFFTGGFAATDFELSPTNAFAELEFRTDGGVYDHDGTKVGSWIFPNSAANSGWEIRATPNPGTPDTGTMNTWLAMSVTRAWSNSENGIGQNQDTFLVEIRYNGGAVADSQNYTITAEVDV